MDSDNLDQYQDSIIILLNNFFFCILLIFINSKLHTFFINKHNSHKQTDTVHHISTYTIHSSLLSSSFKVSSILYCTIYKPTSRQILSDISLFHIAWHFSISLVCLNTFRPKKSLKWICFTNGIIIPPDDLFHKRHNHTTR